MAKQKEEITRNLTIEN